MTAMTSVKLLMVTCFLSATLTTTRADQRAATFKAMTSSTGEVLCAVDEPTEVEWLSVGDEVQCGIKCIVRQCCEAYNFNKLDGKCDKYCSIPYNYTVVPGCGGYIKERKPAADKGVNVALGKPAVQISSYIPYSNAWRAVDGDATSSRSCTYAHLHAWWSVDIGQTIYVGMVNVTGDPSGNAQRLDNFIVGLSNTAPIVGNAMTSSNYTLCRQYSGAFPPGVGNNTQVTCPVNLPPFRYVIVQSANINDDAICLGEVEVYEH